MLFNCEGSNPIIFLITDGAVESERQICQKMEEHVLDRQTKCPRLYTFGIGNIYIYIFFFSQEHDWLEANDLFS